MTAPVILEVESLCAGYRGRNVVHEANLILSAGEIVAVLGAIGAGKTTLLRAISGTVRSTGLVKLRGASLNSAAPHRRATRGLAHVPQGRGTLAQMTVHEKSVGGWGLAFPS